ncbi:hypothetical protein EGR_08985 [Echinococcus granulosus]|uniref:Uncharacterized protein n=1 Tax=Echinococcus granulosus TaxID=6210 RepID=W6U4Z4_ECHGR|nr:hypothetical protein EGR_08985 [Echinococcus granulosus]EUB56180.1 hypothetical protein EGR_08985 [Echinococcus granulosus]
MQRSLEKLLAKAATLGIMMKNLPPHPITKMHLSDKFNKDFNDSLSSQPDQGNGVCKSTLKTISPFNTSHWCLRFRMPTKISYNMQIVVPIRGTIRPTFYHKKIKVAQNSTFSKTFWHLGCIYLFVSKEKHLHFHAHGSKFNFFVILFYLLKWLEKIPFFFLHWTRVLSSFSQRKSGYEMNGNEVVTNPHHLHSRANFIQIA